MVWSTGPTLLSTVTTDAGAVAAACSLSNQAASAAIGDTVTAFTATWGSFTGFRQAMPS